MKKFLLSTSFLVVSSASVMAADLPMMTKAPIVAAPVFSWTGCYVGVHGGGGTMVSNFEGSGSSNVNGKGAVLGGQGGCNYQDGNWVFGVEGEGYWSNIKQTANSSYNYEGTLGYAYNNTLKNTRDFTIAARVGIAFDRTLIYGKAGWAWGSFNQSNGFAGYPPDYNPAYSYAYTQSGTLDGMLVGIGIEHALTRNWTVKAEYNYIAFGSKELATTYCETGYGCYPYGSSSLSATKQLFKLGVNYLFPVKF